MCLEPTTNMSRFCKVMQFDDPMSGAHVQLFACLGSLLTGLGSHWGWDSRTFWVNRWEWWSTHMLVEQAHNSSVEGTCLGLSLYSASL